MVLGAERQELTADSPCVFMRALMFNVSRSLIPSVEGVSEHVCVHVVGVCVCACVCVCVCVCVKKRDPACVSPFSPETLTLFLPLSVAGISISLARLEYLSPSHSYPSGFSYSSSLLLLLPLPRPPLCCKSCVAVYLLCPQGESQLTL